MSYENDNRRSSYEGRLTKDREPLAIKSDGDQGLVSGYSSNFWVVDSYGEVTAPGAFLQTISERGPQGVNRILLRYEHNETIGTHTKLDEDATGLRIEGHISDDGMFGTRVRKHLADGVPYGLSIGFKRHADRAATANDPLDWSSAPSFLKSAKPEDIRVLTSIRLYENSVVAFPANDSSTVTAYRSLDMAVDIEALIALVKSGDLTREHLDTLRSAMPADGLSADGEKLAAKENPQTTRRNRLAEFELIKAELSALGIGD